MFRLALLPGVPGTSSVGMLDEGVDNYVDISVCVFTSLASGIWRLASVNGEISRDS